MRIHSLLRALDELMYSLCVAQEKESDTLVFAVRVRFPSGRSPQAAAGSTLARERVIYVPVGLGLGQQRI